MGEAKRRRFTRPEMIYHHTSTLRTNLLWMSGYVEVEGKVGSAFHPTLGEMRIPTRLRRAMADFPPLAWFTTETAIPRCLFGAQLFARSKTTGEVTRLDPGDHVINAMALNGVALGFPIASTQVVPWPDHPGYDTAEGRALNESAREFGDQPTRWFVSETPVDLMKVTEFWLSHSVLNPRLEPYSPYVAEIHRMVKTCRTTPESYIPPTWLAVDKARALAGRLGVPVG